jgi:hypothetical protein
MHCSSLSKSLAPIPHWLDHTGEIFRPYSKPSGYEYLYHTAAVAHYLQYGRYEYHLKNMRKALYTQCLRYMQAIIDYFPEDTKVSRPHGGFVLWVQLNKKVNDFRLRTEAMKHNISIVPGKIFSASCGYGNCIRISFGKPWDDDADWVDDAGKADWEDDLMMKTRLSLVKGGEEGM